MKKQTVKKSIQIKAPKERVWEVLLNDQFTRIWYAEFSKGSHAETDWRVGSKAVFKDDSNTGIIGTIVANAPFELLSLEYTGVVTPNGEDYDGDMAKQLKGGLETYRLSEQNDVTQLSIECDMPESMFESMSLAWDNALQTLRKLSESHPEFRS